MEGGHEVCFYSYKTCLKKSFHDILAVVSLRSLAVQYMKNRLITFSFLLVFLALAIFSYRLYHENDYFKRLDRANAYIIGDYWFQNYGNEIKVYGSWIYDSGSDYTPVNISHLHCRREKMECILSLSEVYGGLGSLLQIFDVKKWGVEDDWEIVFEDKKDFCIKNVYTVDSKNKLVSNVKMLQNAEDESCSRLKDFKTSISHMGNGNDKYWEYIYR